MGGLARRATIIDRVRKEADGVLYVDGGDDLTGPQVIPVQKERRARLMLDALACMKVDAQAIGEKDRQANVPLKGIRSEALVTRAGLKIGVFSADLEDDPAAWPNVEKAATALRGRGAKLVVALLHASTQKAQPLFATSHSGVDVAVTSHNTFGTPTMAHVGGTWFVEAPMQAKQLGQLDLHILDGKLDFVDVGQRSNIEIMVANQKQELKDIDTRYGSQPQMKEFATKRKVELAGMIAGEEKQLAALGSADIHASWIENQLIPLGADIADSPSMVPLMKKYKEDVAKMPGAPPPSLLPGHAGTAAAMAQPTVMTTGYVGAEQCKRCHKSEFAFWKKSKHAHAWKALTKDGQDKDPACVMCHITAGQRTLVDVQCEACHGPGAQHGAQPAMKGLIVRDAPEPVCKSCHRPPQTTDFEYAAFRKAIVGKGHGDK